MNELRNAEDFQVKIRDLFNNSPLEIAEKFKEVDIAGYLSLQKKSPEADASFLYYEKMTPNEVEEVAKNLNIPGKITGRGTKYPIKISTHGIDLVFYMIQFVNDDKTAYDTRSESHFIFTVKDNKDGRFLPFESDDVNNLHKLIELAFMLAQNYK